MSPRSEEFMAEARERLGAALLVLSRGFAGPAVSLAYYAMLNAARAALSERDLYAKTHGGTWHLFSQTFVAGGDFDAQLAGAAAGVQPVREGVDYIATGVSAEEAERIVALAERFVAAIADMFS
jgi:uncharacterized protein (UPF0332 family)